MYARGGRPSVPPEQLLKACLLMALNSARSERALCEQPEYSLLYRWSLDMDLMVTPFLAMRSSARTGNGCRNTASACICATEPGNPTVDFKGEKLRCETRRGTTDPEARLMRKRQGKEAKLRCAGHSQMAGG